MPESVAPAGQRLRALPKHLPRLRHRHDTDTLRTKVETKPHASFRSNRQALVRVREPATRFQVGREAQYTLAPANNTLLGRNPLRSLFKRKRCVQLLRRFGHRLSNSASTARCGATRGSIRLLRVSHSMGCLHSCQLMKNRRVLSGNRFGTGPVEKASRPLGELTGVPRLSGQTRSSGLATSSRVLPDGRAVTGNSYPELTPVKNPFLCVSFPFARRNASKEEIRSNSSGTAKRLKDLTFRYGPNLVKNRNRGRSISEVTRAARSCNDGAELSFF